MVRTPWLTIIGIGDDGLASLNSTARILFDQAQTIIAPKRVLDIIDTGNKTVIPWTKGTSETIALIKEREGKSVTILATGDPMHYGIGATLRKFFDEEDMIIVPSPSGFSLAAAKLGWRLQDVAMISLHGRAVAGLVPYIQPNRKILALTSNAKTLFSAAEILVAHNYSKSELTVLEHIGGVKQKMSKMRAFELLERGYNFADFNMLAIDCVADDFAALAPCIPGLADDLFLHDGQLTKREVRAITLSHLAPYPNAVLWDIGAGCGSISIEWMRTAYGASAHAIELKGARCEMIAKNANRLGVPNLHVHQGQAHDLILDLPTPDAIFIGGGLTHDGVFDACWTALPSGKKLVANAVTIQSEAYLVDLFEKFGGDLIKLQVSRALPVGKFSGWKPSMPVTLWAVTKDEKGE